MEPFPFPSDFFFRALHTLDCDSLFLPRHLRSVPPFTLVLRRFSQARLVQFILLSLFFFVIFFPRIRGSHRLYFCSSLPIPCSPTFFRCSVNCAPPLSRLSVGQNFSLPVKCFCFFFPCLANLPAEIVNMLSFACRKPFRTWTRVFLVKKNPMPSPRIFFFPVLAG